MTDNTNLNEVKNLYFSGEYERAFDLCEKYAKKNDVRCQTFLGWMHYRSDWKAQDLSSAEKWFNRAIDAGEGEAWFGLGTISFYKEGKEKAFDYFKKAANEGYVPAICRMGLYYKEGTVVPKNLRKAYQLFDEACNKGNIVAARLKLNMMLSGYLGVMGRLQSISLRFYYAYKAFKAKINDENEKFLY